MLFRQILKKPASMVLFNWYKIYVYQCIISCLSQMNLHYLVIESDYDGIHYNFKSSTPNQSMYI